MIPIFDKSGKPVSWIKNGVIFDLSGEAQAFILEEHIFTYTRKYVGTLNQGYFRDQRGHAIAFIQGATGGPALPIPATLPIPPVAVIPPIKPVPPIPPIPPIGSLSWSEIDWEVYINGYV